MSGRGQVGTYRPVWGRPGIRCSPDCGLVRSSLHARVFDSRIGPSMRAERSAYRAIESMQYPISIRYGLRVFREGAHVEIREGHGFIT